MQRFLVRLAWMPTACLLLTACHTSSRVTVDDSLPDYQAFLQQIEYPDAELARDGWAGDAALAPPPSLRRADELEPWPMSLDEAVRHALANSETIRQLGGAVVAAPASTSTIYDPAIYETHPAQGPQAALAAFDAQFLTSLSMGTVDQKFNNLILSGGASTTDEGFAARYDSVGDFRLGLAKTAATGTQFSVGNRTTYNRTYLDPTFQRVPSVYDTTFEASFRHPLLRGGGIAFNRIAGPGAAPGEYRGILIARINSDIVLADFETSVRNLVRDVERTYWELYFAYRDLETKKLGRGYALESWQLEKKRVDAGQRNPDGEAFARDQFYLAQGSVENALSGSTADTGVFGTERHLRSLLGLPASDGRLIRPSTKPVMVDVQFDWQESLDSSFVRRVELRRQRWKVKQRELELVASRNFGRMQLDFVGQYNFRGYGDELFGEGDTAFADLFRADLQGWGLGFELKSPVGNRIGHAAVRNAELMLRREQAILREQDLQITYELREAFTQLDRAYVVTRTSYNRFVAAQARLKAERKRNAVGEARLDLVLEAQRRAVESEVQFHRSVVDYNLSLSRVQFVRGTLLDSLQVYLTEGPWSEEAHALAAREARRYRRRCHVAGRTVPGPISVGAYEQRVGDIPLNDERPVPLDVPPLDVPPLPSEEVPVLPNVEVHHLPGDEAPAPLVEQVSASSYERVFTSLDEQFAAPPAPGGEVPLPWRTPRGVTPP